MIMSFDVIDSWEIQNEIIRRNNENKMNTKIFTSWEHYIDWYEMDTSKLFSIFPSQRVKCLHIEKPIFRTRGKTKSEHLSMYSFADIWETITTDKAIIEAGTLPNHNNCPLWLNIFGERIYENENVTSTTYIIWSNLLQHFCTLDYLREINIFVEKIYENKMLFDNLNKKCNLI